MALVNLDSDLNMSSQLSLLDKILIGPLTVLVVVVLLIAFVLDLAGMPIKPRKAVQ